MWRVVLFKTSISCFLLLLSERERQWKENNDFLKSQISKLRQQSADFKKSCFDEIKRQQYFCRASQLKDVRANCFCASRPCRVTRTNLSKLGYFSTRFISKTKSVTPEFFCISAIGDFLSDCSKSMKKKLCCRRFSCECP